jgi:hypothetical protein
MESNASFTPRPVRQDTENRCPLGMSSLLANADTDSGETWITGSHVTKMS